MWEIYRLRACSHPSSNRSLLLYVFNLRLIPLEQSGRRDDADVLLPSVELCLSVVSLNAVSSVTDYGIYAVLTRSKSFCVSAYLSRGRPAMPALYVDIASRWEKKHLPRPPNRCSSFLCTTTQQTRNQANDTNKNKNNDSKKVYFFQKELIGIVFSRHARKLKSRKQPPPFLLLIDRFPCAPHSLIASLRFSPLEANLFPRSVVQNLRVGVDECVFGSLNRILAVDGGLKRLPQVVHVVETAARGLLWWRLGGRAAVLAEVD